MANRNDTAALSTAEPRPGGIILSRVWLAAILLTTCVVYLPAMNGKMLWDDDAHVTKPELRSVDGLKRIWTEPVGPELPPDANGNRRFAAAATQQYYPLLHSFFWLQWQAFGDNTIGYHLVNLALHLAAVCLVYAVLRKLTVPGAVLAAGIFALHPVQAETVAWITEQKNTLSAVFYLGSMLAYLYFDESRDMFLYALALVLFIFALLSKTVTATLPAALLVIFWWQRGRLSLKRDVLPLLPFFVLGAAFGLVTAWVERNLVGAQGDEFALSFVARCLLAGRVIWFYLAKLLWPANLTFIYPRWEVDPTQAWQWLFSLGVIAVLVVLIAIHGRWRAPLAGALFFIGTLFPVLGFFNVYPFRFSFVADHFQYLASLGVIVPVAAGITLAFRRLTRGTSWMAPVAGAFLLCPLALLASWEIPKYDNAEALYRDTIGRNPLCWMAYNNLGLIFVTQGQLPEAIERFQRAIQLKPNYAEALNNLGKTLAMSGRASESLGYFEQVLQIAPHYPEAHNNLGNALLRLNRPQEALDHLELAVQLKPNYPDAHTNLGLALFKLGRSSEAIEELHQALRLKPDYPEGQCNLGAVLLEAGRPQEALEHFQQAINLLPNYLEGWANLALACQRLGRPTEAKAAAERAIELARAQKNAAAAQQLAKLLSDLSGGQAGPSSSVSNPAGPPP